ncbi:hypothetical protein PRJ_2209 [Pseudomonas sp. XWY-1]|nr:hypothetical protein PRJ_2209 [Pseudomonas sp. XWY-1]
MPRWPRRGLLPCRP